MVREQTIASVLALLREGRLYRIAYQPPGDSVGQRSFERQAELGPADPPPGADLDAACILCKPIVVFLVRGAVVQDHVNFFVCWLVSNHLVQET